MLAPIPISPDAAAAPEEGPRRRLWLAAGADEETIRHMVRGVAIGAALRHRNLLRVHDVEQRGAGLAVTHEAFEGVDAARLLRVCATLRQPLPAGAALRVISQVCLGLDHIHRASDKAGRPLGLALGSVAPDQVRVAPNGDVKVATFRTRDTSARVRLPARQLAGAAPDARGDLVTVGALLLELLAGSSLARLGRAVATIDLSLIVRMLPAGIPSALLDTLRLALDPEAPLRARELSMRLRYVAFGCGIESPRADLAAWLAAPQG